MPLKIKYIAFNYKSDTTKYRSKTKSKKSLAFIKKYVKNKKLYEKRVA